MADPIVSPTGAPVVAPNVMKWIGGILLLILGAVVAKQLDFFPNTEIDQQIASVLIGVLGWLSPGLRK